MKDGIIAQALDQSYNGTYLFFPDPKIYTPRSVDSVSTLRGADTSHKALMPGVISKY